jgi:hypothetical protein
MKTVLKLNITYSLYIVKAVLLCIKKIGNTQKFSDICTKLRSCGIDALV